MPYYYLKRAVLALMCLGMMACGADYKIEAPTKDSIHTTPPSQFKVTYSKQPSKTPKVWLNGFDVASSLTWGATEATGNGADFSDYFIEGTNTFQVNPPLGPQVQFIYDTTGPAVIILGAEINGLATINGLAVDEMGVSSLSVNGTDIDVNADGSFTVDVAPADIYTYNGVDSLGHTSTIQYASLGLEYNPSLSVKVTQGGLDFAMNQVINALNGTDLNALVAGTMLYDATWQGLFGETYGADGFVRNITISVADFNLDLANGGNTSFDGRINTAHVQLTLRMHNGFLPPTIINVGANVGPIDMDGDLHLGVANQAPEITISNFGFHVGAVVIDDVGVVFQAILSGISSGIVNLFNGPISDAIENALNGALPSILSGIIQDSYTIRINDGFNNHDMAMALNLAAITTTENNLYAEMSGGVIPISPNLNIPQPLAGTLYTADPMPAADLGEGDFAISINTNVINQTLASAHSVGLTQMNIIGTNIQFGIPRNDALGGEEATARLLVDTGAPATVKISDIDDAAAIDLSIYGLELSAQSKKGALTYSNDLSVRVNATVAVTLSVGSDNTLDIAFPKAPAVVITGIKIGEGDWSSNAINAIADDLVSTAIGQILEELAKPISSIELPTVACMAFTTDNITAVGGNNSHLNIAGTLTKIDNACDVEIVDPPKVAYGRGVGIPLSCSSSEEYDAGLCYTPCQSGYNGVGPVCWKEDASYGRGVGKIPTMCGAGKENDAGLCYPVCNSGYHGVGPVCWNDRPLSYGRGVGTIPSNIWTGECPSGKENDAGLCYYYCDSGYNGVGPVCWLNNASYGRGVGTIPKSCPAGEENDAGLCYPVCSSGYHGVGPVCWTNQALSYGRGVGVPIHTCLDGMEKDAGLCYEQCDAGYNGIGPVCWPVD